MKNPDSQIFELIESIVSVAADIERLRTDGEIEESPLFGQEADLISRLAATPAATIEGIKAKVAFCGWHEVLSESVIPILRASIRADIARLGLSWAAIAPLPRLLAAA